MIRLHVPARWESVRERTHFADIALLLGVFALIYGVTKVGSGFFTAFNPPVIEPKISLDPINLPYYAARSTLRMFIGLGLSLLFTLTYGYAAAKSKRAERVLIPLLDILQSVPVLGFLSITVTGFIAMFPGNLVGLELASIFAIFTGQAWNMTFSFYHSLITLPKELDEAAKVFRFSKWRRFISVEVPASMIGLVWNAMMSFGGGWFFVAASEAISVLNKNYTLPGIGSYVSTAVKAGNTQALGWAILTIILVIALVDQVFWRPIVAWSEKFRMERNATGEPAQSWMLDLIRAAKLPRTISRFWRRYRPTVRWPKLPTLKIKNPLHLVPRRKVLNINDDVLFGFILGMVAVGGGYFAIRFVLTEARPFEFAWALWLGFLTFVRVLVLLLFATAIWVPIGVQIGFNPKLARFTQPLALLAASFPSNFLFPLAAMFFLSLNVNFNIGSILLMALGAQWYILFNTIAGAMGVPGDLREMAQNMGLKKMQLWKKLIIPAIFPAWVTGAITASGGAWNASIVSEVVTWKKDTLRADGLGSYIAAATQVGDWPRIVLGVSMMCLFVVGANRFVWRRLYTLAEVKYRLG